MKEQIAIQKLLYEKLYQIQGNNPCYSLRAYARKISIDPGTLSNILSGKRNVSIKLAEKIISNLQLDPQQRSEIIDLFPKKKWVKKDSITETYEPRYLEFNAAQFKVVAEWEHFAIMSLMNCGEFHNSPEWISKRLGITPTKAEQALNRLIELGLLSQDNEGHLTRSNKSYRTTDDIASVAMKVHHNQSLELAKESLHKDHISKRDFTTLTMAVDVKKMTKAKELIRRFQDELSDLMESEDQTEVYRLGIQLFPLTKDKA